MTVTLAKWSLDDYHQMIDAGILVDRRVELLNGENYQDGARRARTRPTEYRRRRLFTYNIGLAGTHSGCETHYPPDSNSEPEPDIAIVQPLRQLYRTQHHPYPDNIFWLIEYASSSLAKDLDAKRYTYARAGISEYWVVNLKERCVIVLRTFEAGDYQQESVVSDGFLSPLAFPEVQISVWRLLEGS